MYLQTLKRSRYDLLCAYLSRSAYRAPLEAAYSVRVILDGAEYHLRLQPESHSRMAVLQAWQVRRAPAPLTCALITQNERLRVLLDLLLCRAALSPAEQAGCPPLFL